MIARFHRRMIAATAAVAGLVLAGVASAQVQPQPQPGQQPGQRQIQQRQLQQREQQGQIRQRVARPITQASKTDAQIAAWLIVDNHGEVAISRLAQQRAETDDVKKFATQMVEEHSKIVDKLQPLAGAYARAQGQAGRQQPQGQPGAQPGTQPGAQPGTQPQPGAQPGAQPPRATGGLDIVEVKQRLGQKCLESARSELEKKEGAKFDQCYMGQQVMMHMVMLDTLEVFRNYASPELRPVLEEGIRTTEEHLKTAKDLAETTMDHREVARRNESRGRTE